MRRGSRVTSYEDMDVYKLAKQMAVEIHGMTLFPCSLLPAICYLLLAYKENQ